MKSTRIKIALSIAILIATAVFGRSLPAYAGGEMAGTGLLFNYYDARTAAEGGLGLTDNYYAITNSSTQWVQAHVRVRTGTLSTELLNFDILVSPQGMFTFDLYENPTNGAMTFASCNTQTLQNSGFTLNYARDGVHTDCYILDSTSFPQMISFIQTCENEQNAAATAVLEAKNGYVEVIEEGIIVPCTANTTTCSGPMATRPDDGTATDACGTANAISIPGKTLQNSSAASALITQCRASVFAPNGYTPSTGQLEGKLYYAVVANGIVKKVAAVNGEVVTHGTSVGGPILHYETYNEELMSAQCISGSGKPCYAYVAANVGAAPAHGAGDLNWCFYNDDIGMVPTASDYVVNKYGAATTYGPTLLDLVTVRDGTLATAAGGLNTLTKNLASGNDHGTDPLAVKVFADTHYFASPAPGPYDMLSGFAFTFPLKHFIGEAEIQIRAFALYDTQGNSATANIISCELAPVCQPLATPDAGFTFIRGVLQTFPEGWIRIEPLAINNTGTCYIGGVISDTCTVLGWNPSNVTSLVSNTFSPYVPAYSAYTFVIGANELSVSPFQYSSQLVTPLLRPLVQPASADWRGN